MPVDTEHLEVSRPRLLLLLLLLLLLSLL